MIKNLKQLANRVVKSKIDSMALVGIVSILNLTLFILSATIVAEFAVGLFLTAWLSIIALSFIIYLYAECQKKGETDA